VELSYLPAMVGGSGRGCGHGRGRGGGRVGDVNRPRGGRGNSGADSCCLWSRDCSRLPFSIICSWLFEHEI